MFDLRHLTAIVPGPRGEDSIPVSEHEAIVAKIREQHTREVANARRAESALLLKLGEYDLHDSAEIFERLRNRVFVNEDGQIATRTERGNVSVLDLSTMLSDFLRQRPHHVRSTQKEAGDASPSGAPPSHTDVEGLSRIFGSTSSPKAAQELAQSDPEQYHRLRKQAIEAKLIADTPPVWRPPYQRSSN